MEESAAGGIRDLGRSDGSSMATAGSCVGGTMRSSSLLRLYPVERIIGEEERTRRHGAARQ